MPSRPDLRDIAANVKDAFADADRETLLEILTFVVKEYVVEGPPPMLVHAVENLEDLAGLSFAQLVTALQTRLDQPELQLFAVDGDQVSVRVGGVMQPLSMRGAPTAPPAAELPRPQAGVRVVETTVTRRPPAPAAQPASQEQAAPPPPSRGAAPPPIRGLSMRGRPSGEAAAPPTEQAPPAAPQTPPPAAPAAAPEKPESAGGDEASARFSLLELD